MLLEIEDDGHGISSEGISDLNAVGLLGMRERGRLLGGEVTGSGKTGVGTTVTVRLPAEALDKTDMPSSS